MTDSLQFSLTDKGLFICRCYHECVFIQLVWRSASVYASTMQFQLRTYGGDEMLCTTFDQLYILYINVKVFFFGQSIFPSVLVYCTILYCTALHYTVLLCTLLYYNSSIFVVWLDVFASVCRLLNSNTFTAISDDAFAGLSHLQYLWVNFMPLNVRCY